jgi:hypothetical protein
MIMSRSPGQCRLCRAARTTLLLRGKYAQAQINDATVNVATEFNVMMAQIDNTIAVIMANFPKDAQGRLLFLTFTADNSGRNTSITFAAAQMAPVKTASTRSLQRSARKWPRRRLSQAQNRLRAGQATEETQRLQRRRLASRPATCSLLWRAPRVR